MSSWEAIVASLTDDSIEDPVFLDLTTNQHADLDKLQQEVDDAIQDAIGDFGEETVESGGWAEITRAIIVMSDYDDVVKLEALRIAGLEQKLRLPY